MTELVGSKSHETSRETKLQGLAADGIDIHETTEQPPVIKPSIALRDDPHYRIDPERFYGWFRSYVRQDWGTINVREGGEIEELRAGWIELFFDLIYVAGIVHISSEAVYSLDTVEPDSYYTTTEAPSARRLAGSSDGELVSSNYDFLEATLVQFGLLVCCWNEQVAIESRFANEQTIDQMLRFATMTSILLMGSAIKDEQQYFQFFLFAFVLVKFCLILTYSKISLIPRARNHCLMNIFVDGLEIVFCTILLMTVHGNATTWIYAYISVFIISYCGGWVHWIPCNKIPGLRIPVNVPHVAERYGLFTMLILGEAIISLMTADASGLDAELGFFAWISLCFVAFLLTYAVGLLYFACQPSEEKILSGINTHAMRSSKGRARLFVVSHTFLQFGLLGFGVGTKIIAQHLNNTKRQAIDVMMAGWSLVVVCISLNLIRLSHPFEKKRTWWVWLIRVLCLVVMSCVEFLWNALDNFAILTIITLCILIQVLVDEEGKETKREMKHETKEKVKEAVERQTTAHSSTLHSVSSITKGGDFENSKSSRNNNYEGGSSGNIHAKVVVSQSNTHTNTNTDVEDEKSENYKRTKNRQAKDDAFVVTPTEERADEKREKARGHRAQTSSNLTSPRTQYFKKTYSGVGFM